MIHALGRRLALLGSIVDQPSGATGLFACGQHSRDISFGASYNKEFVSLNNIADMPGACKQVSYIIALIESRDHMKTACSARLRPIDVHNTQHKMSDYL